MKKSRTFASAIEKQPRTSKCPDGGIGRRAGLKHQWIHFHPGSTPGLGTGKGESSKGFLLFLYILSDLFYLISSFSIRI